MAAGHLALLCLGLSLLYTNVDSQSRCSVPTWNSQLGNNPFTANRGKVLLVALLRGYCSYCVLQAGRLEQLKNNLTSSGYTDIEMIIINGGESLSRRNVQNLRRASNIRVLQDKPSHIMFRQIFNGNKDDFVVYDRCGQRTAYIPHPYSNLNHNVTERVLKAVHNGRHSCHCELDTAPSDPHEVMYGDQPGQSVNTVSLDSLDLGCSDSDRMCRRYQRNYRRNRLEHGSRRNNHHRHGTAVWDCTNVSLSPVVRVPTHRCRCPQANVGDECKCTIPIYGQENDILSWHCGCHNPSFETQAQCDHCHVCDNRRICRNVTQIATWQEYCRCQQQDNPLTWQWQNADGAAMDWQWQNASGTTTDWQGTNTVWGNSISQTWQWQNSGTGNWQGTNTVWENSISQTWQWQNSGTGNWQGTYTVWANSIPLNWQWQNSGSRTGNWQGTNTVWGNSLYLSWQWQNSGTSNWQGTNAVWVNSIPLNWQWQNSSQTTDWQGTNRIWENSITLNWQWWSQTGRAAWQ